MRAVYCKCKNTYSIDCKNKDDKNCKTPYYWKQGVGSCLLYTSDAADE